MTIKTSNFHVKIFENQQRRESFRLNNNKLATGIYFNNMLGLWNGEGFSFLATNLRNVYYGRWKVMASCKLDSIPRL